MFVLGLMLIEEFSLKGNNIFILFPYRRINENYENNYYIAFGQKSEQFVKKVEEWFDAQVMTNSIFFFA